MNPGFYKLDASGELLYGLVVVSPTFTLTAATRADFSYPLDGWHWFDSEEEARFVLGLGSAPQPPL